MSEDRTAEANGSRSFEERVFARFDSVESRIERLEMKQYDTKPIWEHCIAAIAETNALMRAGFDELRIELVNLNTRFDARFNAVDARFDAIDIRLNAIDIRFDAIDARFATLSTDLDNGLRGVERKIDVLNQYILDLRADQRYVDSRLEKIESKVLQE